jgi:3-oxoacyl-[acyl-carrier-protein] synthase II
MLGHLLGAAGAVSAAVAVLTIRDNILPPTLNLENPDPDCDLDFVPGVARRAEVDASMANAFGFGGQNASVVFKRYHP